MAHPYTVLFINKTLKATGQEITASKIASKIAEK